MALTLRRVLTSTSSRPHGALLRTAMLAFVDILRLSSLALCLFPSAGLVKLAQPAMARPVILGRATDCKAMDGSTTDAPASDVLIALAFTTR